MLLTPAIRRYVPPSLLRSIQRVVLRQEMRRSVGRSHEDIFGDIYNANAWGGTPTQFSSGSGSDEGVNDAYVNLVLSLVKSEQVSRMVDLGCGDFRVGRRIAGQGTSYIGCDIVRDVIQRNCRDFQQPGIEFRKIDIVKDCLPNGDLCIIRQVFQHLSNDDISTVLEKSRSYRLVLITDEQVLGDSAPANCDILPYHGTRRLFGQGLRLEREPFKEKIDVLLEHSSGVDYGPTTRTYLRTVLIRNGQFSLPRMSESSAPIL